MWWFSIVFTTIPPRKGLLLLDSCSPFLLSMYLIATILLALSIPLTFYGMRQGVLFLWLATFIFGVILIKNAKPVQR